MGRTDEARACGAFCLLPVDLDVNADIKVDVFQSIKALVHLLIVQL